MCRKGGVVGASGTGAADLRFAGIDRRSGRGNRRRGWRLALAALFAISSVAPGRAEAASLGAVTPLDGIDAFSGVALSADGSTVVGSRLNRTRPNPAFLWTRSDGFRDLDELGPAFRAEGVSGDGSRIAGSLDGQPVVWDRAGALTALALPVGGTSGGAALGISDDGRTVVGRAHDGGVVEDVVILPGGGIQVIERPREVPVIWSLTGGSVVALADTSGEALDVSSDGVAVGTLELPSSIGEERGFRWSAASDLQFLPTGTPGSGNPWAFDARAISADGLAIVGLTPGPPSPARRATSSSPVPSAGAATPSPARSCRPTDCS